MRRNVRGQIVLPLAPAPWRGWRTLLMPWTWRGVSWCNLRTGRVGWRVKGWRNP